MKKKGGDTQKEKKTKRNEDGSWKNMGYVQKDQMG